MKRLERATERLRSGDYKRTLGDLWYAEAEHRADVAALREALSLAEAVLQQADGRVRKEAEMLVSVLASDLDRAQHPPQYVAEAPRARSRLGVVAAWAALVAVVMFVAGLAVLGDLLDTSETREDTAIALVFLSFASALVAVVVTVVWAIVAHRSRRREHSE